MEAAMQISPAKAPKRKRANSGKKSTEAVINIRVSMKTKELIDTAASEIGKSRSEFMLESAQQKAIDVMLDRRILALPSDQFEAFTAVLENPPPPAEALVELFKRKAPWEK